MPIWSLLKCNFLLVFLEIFKNRETLTNHIISWWLFCYFEGMAYFCKKQKTAYDTE